MTRHEMRECAFTLIFQNDFYPVEEFIEQRDNCISELNVSEEEKEELIAKLDAIILHLPEIDDEISKNSKGWKLDRIAKAELAIMRLAVYEALFDDEVPVKVALDEAVILAKDYCGEKSFAYVNGVLGKIVNE